MTLLEKHLNNLYNARFRAEARRRGRALTGGPNACAAVASQYYIALGILTQAYVNTAALAEALLRAGLIRIPLAQAAAGDMIVCVDDPADDDPWPEHVWHLYGLRYPAKSEYGVLPAGWAWAVDNYMAQPYPRNLRVAGPKTRGWYAIRLAAPKTP